MARFDPSVFTVGDVGFYEGQRAIRETLSDIAESRREERRLAQAKLDAESKSAAEQAQDPAFILSRLREGDSVTPQQQAILDIASAKAQRTFVDPNTGQLVTAGGFPAVREEAVVAAPEGIVAERAQVTETPAGVAVDESAQALLATARTPRERAEIRRQLTQEAFEKRKEGRTLDLQKKKDLSQTRELKRTLDTLIEDPELEQVSGFLQGRQSRELPATKAQRRLQPVVNKLQGQQFLQAYQSLRGGGQITEIEGKKAEQAQAALDQTMDDADYKKALTDYRKIIENGIARLEGKEPPHTFEAEDVVEEAPSINEGRTATNPQTGQKLIFRGGQWRQM